MTATALPALPALLPAAAPPAAGPGARALDLYQAALAGRNARTVRAYASDYQDFATFMQAPTPAAALEALVSLPAGTANACALAYRHHLMGRGLATATIARRLAALRAAVRLARQLGRCGYELEVESPRAESYRDTRGPGRDGYLRVLELAREGVTTPKGRRDLALIRLLHDVALRRAEVLALDTADVDIQAGTVAVIGKGKTSKTPMTLPGPTRAALADWLAVRGEEPGPVFTRLDGPGRGQRLTGRGLHKVCRELGRKARLSRPLRPHGLRHAGITRALDLTGGNVREVRKFSRHAKLDTLMIYDDNRADVAGAVAALVADD